MPAEDYCDPSGIRTLNRRKTENPVEARPWPRCRGNRWENRRGLESVHVVSGRPALQSHGTLAALCPRNGGYGCSDRKLALMATGLEMLRAIPSSREESESFYSKAACPGPR